MSANDLQTVFKTPSSLTPSSLTPSSLTPPSVVTAAEPSAPTAPTSLVAPHTAPTPTSASPAPPLTVLIIADKSGLKEGKAAPTPDHAEEDNSEEDLLGRSQLATIRRPDDRRLSRVVPFAQVCCDWRNADFDEKLMRPFLMRHIEEKAFGNVLVPSNRHRICQGKIEGAAFEVDCRTAKEAQSVRLQYTNVLAHSVYPVTNIHRLWIQWQSREEAVIAFGTETHKNNGDPTSPSWPISVSTKVPMRGTNLVLNHLPPMVQEDHHLLQEMLLPVAPYLDKKERYENGRLFLEFATPDKASKAYDLYNELDLMGIRVECTMT